MLALFACQDDDWQSACGDIPQGSTTISLTANFQTLQPALTRAVGDAIQTIDNLYVLFYDTKGNLTENGCRAITSFTNQGGHGAGEVDDCRTFTLTDVPYGVYRIYAVAGIAGLDQRTNIRTEAGLKAISLTWDADNVAANKQMFGYFTTDGEEEGNIFNAPDLTINRSGMSFQAWVRRAASKVTVAFDGSKLNDNVYIYLKSVAIKDIPKHCFLGKSNEVGAGIAYDSNDLTQEVLQQKADLLTDGDSLIFSTSEDYTRWPLLTNGLPYYYYNMTGSRENTAEAAFLKAAHAEDQESLFFFENMQGTGKSKLQDNNKDGKLDNPGNPNYPEDAGADYNYLLKDDKLFGSYVEVKAFYYNKTADVSYGNIVYRFMLGKNVTDNYDAQRNHHYKLTLKFNKDANDVDWHIEYHENTPALYVQDTCYVSYLYHQQTNLPVKVNGYNVRLKAEILNSGNHWWPDGAGTDVYVGTSSANKQQPWNGFLSLTKKTSRITVGTGVIAPKGSDSGGENYKDYYNNKRDAREYDGSLPAGQTAVTRGGDKDNQEGSYSVTDSKNGGVLFNIPLYTRAKQLTSTTAYSGNNFFEGYTRTAKVKLTATCEDALGNEKTLTKTITVIQVKRLVNPTGIWRSASNNKPFKVVLMEQEGTGGFHPLTSHGPWRAFVEAESVDGLIKLNDGQTTVEGATESEIRFTYTPTKSSGCGIIRVEYHDYNCVHRIFVSKGQEPVLMESSRETKDLRCITTPYTPKRWHVKNVKVGKAGGAQEVDNPLYEGSLFKMGNYTYAIYASNNSKFGFMVNLSGATLSTSGGNLAWTSMNPTDHSDDTRSFNSYPVIGTAKTATFDDWAYLKLNFDHGYGVMFGDEVDTNEKVTTETKAYEYGLTTGAVGMRGCFVYDVGTGNHIFFPIGATGYGRRVGRMNAYSNARKGSLRYGGALSRLGNGTSSAENVTIPIASRPLLADLYKMNGAVYWCRAKKQLGNNYYLSNNNTAESNENPFFAHEYRILSERKKGVDHYKDYNSKNVLNHRAWDINYFTLDFNTHKSDSWPDQIYEDADQYTEWESADSDACFIRLVE